jgi:hypothetical protein
MHSCNPIYGKCRVAKRDVTVLASRCGPLKNVQVSLRLKPLALFHPNTTTVVVTPQGELSASRPSSPKKDVVVQKDKRSGCLFETQIQISWHPNAIPAMNGSRSLKNDLFSRRCQKLLVFSSSEACHSHEVRASGSPVQGTDRQGVSDRSIAVIAAKHRRHLMI